MLIFSQILFDLNKINLWKIIKNILKYNLQIE